MLTLAGRNAGDLLHRRGRRGGGGGAAARRTSLGSILVLPLAIPVLIFGVSASYAAVDRSRPVLPPFMILSAIALFFAAASAAASPRLAHSGKCILGLICRIETGSLGKH
jgi:uncharacterized membrane protein